MTPTDLHVVYKKEQGFYPPEMESIRMFRPEIANYIEWLEERVLHLDLKVQAVQSENLLLKDKYGLRKGHKD